MSRLSAIPAALGLLLLAQPGAGQTTGQEALAQETIRLSEVPQAAREAARQEIGRAPTDASIMKGSSPQAYELAGKNESGKKVTVDVQADGTVIKKKIQMQP